MPTTVPAPLPAEVAAAAAVAAELLDALQRRSTEGAEENPIPPSQLRALLAVERSEGTNLRLLGKALGSKPPAVSRLCDRMQADGLLERSLSANSRREVELRLSQRGHSVLAEHRASRLRRLHRVLATMPVDQLRSLTCGLTAFHDAALALHDA